MARDARLEALRSESTLVARGTFDLDPARAREKLARYQLVDPHRYVLQFAQAAELLGATRVNVFIDADEAEFSFDGDALTAAELSEIYVHAFGRRGVPRLEALRHLALGVIAAEAMNPAVIEVETTEAQLVISRGSEDVEEAGGQQNRIYVREVPRLGHLWEFLQNILDVPAEVTALNAARFTKPKLIVNGTVINDTTKPPRGSVPIETGFETGWVAVGRRGPISLVQHGVVLEELDFSIGDFNIHGVVSTTRAATNLSQSAFVRNRSWDELTDEVLTPAALRASARQLERTLAASDRRQASATIAIALHCRIAHLSRGLAIPPIVDEIVMTLADAEVWRRLADRHDSRRYASTRELLVSIGEDDIIASDFETEVRVLRDRLGRQIAHVLYDDRRAVLTSRLFAEATGRVVRDVSDTLRDAHRLRTQQGPGGRFDGLHFEGGHAQLASHAYQHRAQLETEDLRVEAGLPRQTIALHTDVIVIGDPHVVRRIERAYEPLLGMTVLIDESVRSEDPIEEIVRRAAPLIADACVETVIASEVPSDYPPKLAVRLLGALVRGTIRERVCRSVGWTEAEIAGLPSEEFAKMAVEERADLLGQALQIPMFDVVGHEARLSICDLDGTAVQFVPRASRRRALQIEWELSICGGGQVLWLDDDGLALLRWVLGDDGVVDIEEELRSRAARVTHQRGGLREEPILHGLHLEKRALQGDGVAGEVGLAGVVAGPGFIEVVLLRGGKRLAHRELPVPGGQFRAIVEAPELTAEADMSDVVEDDAWLALRRRIIDVCGEMFEQWCVSVIERGARDPDETLALWRAVASEGGGHRTRWSVFETASGETVSLERLRRLAGDHLVVVSHRAEFEGFAIRLPLAAARHLELLRALLPEVEIERVGARPIAGAVGGPGEPSPWSRPEPTGRFADLIHRLRSVGIDVDSIHFDDGDAGPTVRDRQVCVGREHAIVARLQEHPGSSRAYQAIALALALTERDDECLVQLVNSLGRSDPERDSNE